MIAVIGGGISGLAAAYELSRAAVPFTLFEASSRLGGLVRTERTGGFTIEAGADSMLAQKRAGVELARELGLTPRLISMQHPRTAFVLRGGALHPLPSPSMLGIPATWRGLALYSLLSPAARARIAAERFIPAATHAQDESIASFFRRRFGDAAVDLLAQPLLGGIHAGDIEALSLRALFPRLWEAERSSGSVLRWVQRMPHATGTDGAFRSLAGGMSELVEALAARLPRGAVRLQEPVERLERSGSRWTVRTSAGASEHAAVVVACPAYVAARLLAPLDAEAAGICRAIRYVSTMSVALAWPRAAIAHPLAGSGFVVPRATGAMRLTACTWVSSKWAQRAPAESVLLRAYLGGACDPDAVSLTDPEVIDIATRELSTILSIEGPPALARVYRWVNAGAQHEVGHLARLAALEARLDRLPGLFVTGSGFRSIGIPDCIADGRAVGSRAGTFTHAH